MPLIQKPKPLASRVNTKLSLEKNIADEVKAYCDWAEITVEHFFESAAKMVFEKDKDWKIARAKLG